MSVDVSPGSYQDSFKAQGFLKKGEKMVVKDEVSLQEVVAPCFPSTTSCERDKRKLEKQANYSIFLGVGSFVFFVFTMFPSIILSSLVLSNPKSSRRMKGKAAIGMAMNCFAAVFLTSVLWGGTGSNVEATPAISANDKLIVDATDESIIPVDESSPEPNEIHKAHEVQEEIVPVENRLKAIEKSLKADKQGRREGYIPSDVTEHLQHLSDSDFESWIGKRVKRRLDRREKIMKRATKRFVEKMLIVQREALAGEIDRFFLSNGMSVDRISLHGRKKTIMWIHYPLCSRAWLYRHFEKTNMTGRLKREGFTKVGCKSYFQSTWYDL